MSASVSAFMSHLGLSQATASLSCDVARCLVETLKVLTARLCACPVWYLQAYTAAKKGDDVASTQALFQLANLLMRLPIIETSSSQVELIADELKGWADRDILLRLQEVLLQVLEDPKQQQVVTGMLGL